MSQTNMDRLTKPLQINETTRENSLLEGVLRNGGKECGTEVKRK